jgi:hypothetical protein
MSEAVATFGAVLAREWPAAHPNMCGRVAALLISIGSRSKRLAEAWCNGSIDEQAHERAQRMHVDGPAAEAMAMIAAMPTIEAGKLLLIQNDPRGATIKLILPSGYTDDFGGTGFCVPGS